MQPQPIYYVHTVNDHCSSYVAPTQTGLMKMFLKIRKPQKFGSRMFKVLRTNYKIFDSVNFMKTKGTCILIFQRK